MELPVETVDNLHKIILIMQFYIDKIMDNKQRQIHRLSLRK